MVLAISVMMLSACVAGAGDSGGETADTACVEREVRMAVRGQITVPTQRQRSTKPSKLVLSVYESSTAACDGEYVQITAPGRQLVHTSLDGAAFDLEVSFTTIEDFQEALSIQVFVDENDNGLCDDDEPAGNASTAPDGSVVAPVELTSLGCPGRA